MVEPNFHSTFRLKRNLKLDVCNDFRDPAGSLFDKLVIRVSESRCLRMRYVPYHKLGGTPNLIVDGKANDGTVLTLSHWPASGTPAVYKDDLSAQIVYRYLERDSATPEAACSVVSNNHFDEDGLVSLYAILNPQAAAEERHALIDIASAGDFGVFNDRESARVSFVLSAWANPGLSPLNSGVFARPHPEITAILYDELLVRLPKIMQKIDNLRRYWRDEDDFLTRTEDAIEAGKISLIEYPEIDLLVVRIEENAFATFDREHCASWISSVLHPMAIHNRTQRMRILVMCGKRYEFYYRYETWVDYVSRPLKKRIDLTALAKTLSKLENGKCRWQFNGIDDIIARLKLTDGEETRIKGDDFLTALKSALSESDASA